MPPPVSAAVAYKAKWTQIPANAQLPPPPPPPPLPPGRTRARSPLVPKNKKGGSKKRVSKTRHGKTMRRRY